MATTATEHENATRFRQGYDAFGRGDVDALRKVIAADAVWHNAGRNRFSGDQRGIDNILMFFGRLQQDTGGTFKLDVHDIVANDEHGVALVSSTAEVNGRRIDSKGAHVVHFRDGQITESWYFDWDPYTFDEALPA